MLRVQTNEPHHGLQTVVVHGTRPEIESWINFLAYALGQGPPGELLYVTVVIENTRRAAREKSKNSGRQKKHAAELKREEKHGAGNNS